MTKLPETTTLYRIENPNIPANPDGAVSHEDLVGQWFTPDVDTALGYLRKSTQTFGRDAAPVDGAQLVMAHVPMADLERMDALRHPVVQASRMDVEPGNYIVPRDGTVPTEVLPLDDVVGDLRGNLGNTRVREEARERVHAELGKLMIRN